MSTIISRRRLAMPCASESLMVSMAGRAGIMDVVAEVSVGGGVEAEGKLRE